MADDTKKQDATSKDSHQSKENIDNVKAVSAVAYFGILFFIPMLTNPKSKFAMFHANQGLLLLIASFVGYTACTILSFALIGLLLFPLFGIYMFVMFILGIVNAMNGDMKRLPLIGNFDLIKPQV